MTCSLKYFSTFASKRKTDGGATSYGGYGGGMDGMQQQGGYDNDGQGGKKSGYGGNRGGGFGGNQFQQVAPQQGGQPQQGQQGGQQNFGGDSNTGNAPNASTWSNQGW